MTHDERAMTLQSIGDVAARVVTDLAAKYGYGLTPLQKALRRDKCGSSFLPWLMDGNVKKTGNEWLRLVGSPDWVPEDFSRDWSVQGGSYMEPFIMDWHERKTGKPLTRRGEVVLHPERPWFCCTLDAHRSEDDRVIDAKFIGHWRKIDDVISFYTPQLIGQMGCTGAKNASLLIVHGGTEPVEYPVEIDPDYERLVWERVDEFWHCVETLTPPVELPPAPAPVKAEKTYDMRPSNAWAAHAAVWLANFEAGRLADGAAKELKSLVPDDAAKVHGHGVFVQRDRAGRLSLRKDTAS